MLSIANNYSAKLTFFTDALEFIRMEQHKNFSDGINRVKKQLSTSVLDGHDVQLHIHPQWKQAKYEDYQWHLDFKFKSI